MYHVVTERPEHLALGLPRSSGLGDSSSAQGLADGCFLSSRTEQATLEIIKHKCRLAPLAEPALRAVVAMTLTGTNEGYLQLPGRVFDGVPLTLRGQ